MINVTAAIIERGGKFLIAKRKKGKHLENKWEFPGGKIEPQETAEECLRRELKEEFGITAEIGSFVAESVFDQNPSQKPLLAALREIFSLSARRDEEAVALATATRSNAAGRENRRNPCGIWPIFRGALSLRPRSTERYTFGLAPCAAKDWPISRPKRFLRWVLWRQSN